MKEQFKKEFGEDPLENAPTILDTWEVDEPGVRIVANENPTDADPIPFRAF